MNKLPLPRLHPFFVIDLKSEFFQPDDPLSLTIYKKIHPMSKYLIDLVCLVDHIGEK